MLPFIHRFLLVCLQAICCCTYSHSFFGRRPMQPAWKYPAILSIWILSLNVFLPISRHSFLSVQVLTVCVTAFAIWGIWKASAAKAFVLSFSFHALLLASDGFALLLYRSFFHRIYLMRDVFHMDASLLAIYGKGILFLTVLLIRRIHGKPLSLPIQDTGDKLRRTSLCFLALAASACFLAWDRIAPDAMERLFFTIVFALLGISFCILYLVDSILNRERSSHKKRLFQLKAKDQAAMYRSLSENYEKQRQKTHEYKNQILCIQSLLLQKEYEKLEEYVASISGRLHKELDAFDTNHIIANAIINSKYQEMLEKGIAFIPKISDLSTLPISDEDLTAILSNLLENAIEACTACKGRKMIKMKFVIEDGYTLLSVKNTYEGRIPLKDGEIQTSKTQESAMHGVGLKNILETIETYGGSYIIQTEGGEFYIAIQFPPQES